MSKPRREGTARRVPPRGPWRRGSFHEQAPARGDCKAPAAHYAARPGGFHEQAPARGDCKVLTSLRLPVVQQGFMSKPRREGTARYVFHSRDTRIVVS